MNKLGKLFVVAAPSGAGKTTIVKHIRNKYPELVFSVSATTRKKRDIETHGSDYFFLQKKSLKKEIIMSLLNGKSFMDIITAL